MAGLRGRALVAYLLVCMVWGSTYLAIRIGVADLPPFLFAGVRFLIAGVLLAGAVLPPADSSPARAREWKILGIGGIFLLVGGNAIVVWAEQTCRLGSRASSSRPARSGPPSSMRWSRAERPDSPGGSGSDSARVPRQLPPRRRDAGPDLSRPNCGGRSPSRSRARRGPWVGLQQASPTTSVRPIRGRGADDGCRRAAPDLWVGARGGREPGISRRPALGALAYLIVFGSHRRLHRVRLRAAPCLRDDRRDVRVREPGGRGAARLADPRTRRSRPHARGDGADSGRGALDPALVARRARNRSRGRAPRRPGQRADAA